MIRLFATLMATLLLAGCALTATRPATPATADAALLQRWWQHQQALRSVDQFLLQGRLAASGMPLSGRLRWQQSADGRFDVFVSGPVGSGSVRLRGTPDAVHIQSGDDDWHSRTPEADLQHRLGWRLPLAALPYWARGLPRPGRPARYDLDPAGRLLRLQQDGWDIHFDRYHPGSPALPARLRMIQDSTTLTLLADRWQQP